jgi:parallel beta helix pectate lyase-like protein
MRKVLACLVAAFLAAMTVAVVSVGAAGPCDTARIVQPTSNLQGAIDASGTYCLRGGVYQESDRQITINADNVTVSNVPGERAEIRGRVRTNDGASNVRFIGTDVSANVEGIVLNSSYSPISWSTSGGMGHFTSDPHLIRGNGTRFENVEFDGDNDVLGDPWYNSRPSTPARAIGTCILVADGTDGSPAADVVFLNNDIHNCGAAPDSRADNVGTHALYLSGGLRVQVEHNMIYENGTRGVQIRSGTDNTHVYGNIIDENYVGVGFDDPDTNGNIVENNLATRNANKNIRNLSDAGTGNVARNNCGYGVPIPNGTSGNVSYSNNVTVSSNPYSVDPEPNADAKVGNSTCAAKLPAGSPFK